MSSDLGGKTFLVTGSNTGIGRVTAHELAARGARVLLACRSEDKTRPVIDEIRSATKNDAVEFIALDLADLESVRACADRYRARGEPLHCLINNAGLAGQRGTTKQGFELTFGVNHLGHFLLTKLLLPRIREASPSRIVNVASQAHYDAKSIDWSLVRGSTRTVTGLPEYAVSKLSNVLHAKELARREAGTGVTTYSLHPGVVASDVWRQVPWPFRSIMKLFMISNEDGAKTTLYCATSPEVATESGRYYDRSKEKKPNPIADDLALARELWERSEEWVAPYAD